jgi:hypothetical protein
MLESGSSGSVRGLLSNEHPYREPRPEAEVVEPANLHQGGSSAAFAANDPLRLSETGTSHVTARLLDCVGTLLDQEHATLLIPIPCIDCVEQAGALHKPWTEIAIDVQHEN